jgi:DNA-binding response OmpR family regulator
MEYGGIKLDMLKGIVSYLDRGVELTKNEMGIMKILFENKGTIVCRNDIINSLWQSDEFIDDNTLTVNVTRIRKKMESIGIFDFIKTKRGMGYMI